MRLHIIWFLILGAGVAALKPSAAHAFDPESPVVVSMVSRAAKYVETNRILTPGHRALVAMALLKADYPATHPIITETASECKAICASVESIGHVMDIYETSVVGLFLSDLNAGLYEAEIANLVKSLESRQKEFGGWGYPKPQTHWETGDTSMTQYAILFAWVARNTISQSISPTSLRQVCNWLIRTQDVQGAWGYQGRDPGKGVYSRVPQTEIRNSLCVAGLGSMYICSNLLGFTSGISAPVSDEDLPPALKPVLIPSSAAEADREVDQSLVQKSIRDATRWHQRNYRINPEDYPMYYLYTLERAESFKELAEGRSAREPRWYNDGVAHLRRTQQRDGSWEFPGGSGQIPETCFGILFLKRSAQKTIQAVDPTLSGVLTAGRGLPSNTADVKIKAGNIVRTPFQGTADALLSILDSATQADLESIEYAQIELSENATERKQQLRRLRRMTGAESYAVRMAAVRGLGSVRDLDNVPALIFALGDPDPRVVQAAKRGLRFISRKFQGVGLVEFPSVEEVERATEAWRDWYLKIRPGAYLQQR